MEPSNWHAQNTTSLGTIVPSNWSDENGTSYAINASSHWHPQNATSNGTIAPDPDPGGCLICKLNVIIAMFEMPDNDHEKKYICITDSADEPDNYEGMMYEIDLPPSFLEAHQSDILPGLTYICIPGGIAIREVGSIPEIIVPTGSEISIVNDIQFDPKRRLVQTIGDRTVLVVRVITQTESPSASLLDLEGAIFGTGSQALSNSLVSQFKSCSFNQLNLVKATGSTLITNGMMELDLSVSIKGRDISVSFYNEIQKSLTTAIGSSPTVFSHVIHCMPYGTLYNGDPNWLAHAIPYGYQSYYNDENCRYLAVMMHETAHNLGLYHAWEKGIEYGDVSGHMGGRTSPMIDGPQKCFNGHNNYALGWYLSKTIEVFPNNGPRTVRVAAFVDYTTADISKGEYVIIKVGDVFLQYNRKKSFNSGTEEMGDMVTITTSFPHFDGTVLEMPTNMLAGLGKGRSYSRGGIVYQVCTLVPGGLYHADYALMSIHVVGDPSTCPGIKVVPPAKHPPIRHPISSRRSSNKRKKKKKSAKRKHGKSAKGKKQGHVRSYSTATAMESVDAVMAAAPDTLLDAATPCDDSDSETFVVRGSSRNCAWLRARPSQIGLLCIPGLPAYDICEETCGQCYDTCEDDDGKTFFVNSRTGYQTCSWLALRPVWQSQLCVPTHEVWTICGETCNSCDAII